MGSDSGRRVLYGAGGHHGIRLFLAAVAGWVGACGGGATDRCVPGRAVECPCPGGSLGRQLCGEDRTFGECECGAGSDAGADADGTCASNADCDDNRFCNGPEQCLPHSDGADERGCVLSADEPCLSNQACDETNDRCLTECGVSGDADGDGHDAFECGGDDCDDSDPARFPGNPEICDAAGHDEDCDPSSVASGVDGDRDNDGYTSSICCNGQEDGSLSCGDDCDDARSGVHPGASEACNGLDDDCAGGPDDGVQLTFYRDVDGDGFGRDADTVPGCSAPTGYALVGGDCDDDDGMLHPAARERCDGRDNNCDGEMDTGCECVDGDRVTCGLSDVPPCRMGVQRCVDGVLGSCDDVVDPTSESCNGVDDDCDGDVDEGQLATFYRDVDGDGFGVPSDTRMACTIPGGHAVLSGDCDDARPSIHPAATELCDRFDNDCDQVINQEPEASDDCGTAPDAVLGCVSGYCRVTDCSPGTADCDDVVANGCETDATTASDCGACGRSCLLMCSEASCDESLTVRPGGVHTCVRQQSGGVACWGNNSQGELGQGSTSAPLDLAVSVTGLDDAVLVSSGFGYSCAVRSTGQLVCWGRNQEGQLGDDSKTNRHAPQEVPGMTDVAQVSTSINGYHTCAVRGSGQLACWGFNANGQLGLGDTAERLIPVDVPGMADVREVAVGGRHTCALRLDGTVWCWGQNNLEQLGRTPTASEPADEPGQVPGLSGIVELEAGSSHTCARSSGRQMWCWGANTVGQLGDGSTVSNEVPQLVPLSSVRGIAVGGGHSCARHASGGLPRLSCWGQNDLGQVGDGTTVERHSPSLVSLTSGLDSVDAGRNHTCARLNTTQLLCWGGNSNGQLGDGTRLDHPSPTRIVAVPVP